MTPIWKKRIDKLTYGLIYPAFFGNMIYDLMLFKKNYKNQNELYVDLASTILITLFYAVDYIHLHADMNKIVSDSSKKSPEYLLCDVATSLLFFTAFVCIKEALYPFCLPCLVLIPFFIWLYKRKNILNQKNNQLFVKFLVFGIAISVVYFGLSIFFKSEIKEYNSYILLGIVAIFFVSYVYYVFSLYPKEPKELDIKFMKTANQY